MRQDPETKVVGCCLDRVASDIHVGRQACLAMLSLMSSTGPSTQQSPGAVE